ncbi:MAG: hypothetical protein RIS85_1682 [Pseudomonadota bacterium]
MFALLCTMLFAAAAIFAIGAIVVTMQGRRGQIAALIMEYRTLKRDREFLFHIIAQPSPTAPLGESTQPRRLMRRSIRRGEAVRAVRVLRAAA